MPDNVDQCGPDSRTKEMACRPRSSLKNAEHIRCSPWLGRKSANANLLILENSKYIVKVSTKPRQWRKGFERVPLEHIGGVGQQNKNGLRWKHNIQSENYTETTHNSAPSEQDASEQKKIFLDDTTTHNIVKVKKTQQKSIDQATAKYKQPLCCVQCLEIGMLAKDGTTRFHEKILKCSACSEQVTHKACIS